MLFGEYSLICGSMGLVVPLKQFNARWNFADKSNNCDFALQSNNQLRSFCDFLSGNEPFSSQIDHRKFKNELENGLFFDSSIPQGYGSGSSGALVAAVYQRYTNFKIEPSLIELRTFLAGMESFFHGNSSGIDPISCYLDEPVLIHENGDIQCVENPFKQNTGFNTYLIDTGLPRETSRLMQHFAEQINHYSFFKKLRDQLIPAVNQSIKHFRLGETDAFFNQLSIISNFQLHYFAPMIPEILLSDWKNGLESGEFICKICGSGGGGYMLAFAKNQIEISRFTGISSVDPLS
ncbi:MAG: mevalonate kinase family protein [Bacteroidales bacterium]